ncbi:MAG: hypothetical protein II567_14500, partial [Candidatus Riflebacteria bacterium]|nr:hypothetical protein [Candidatus Riflebacteria bacterium]
DPTTKKVTDVPNYTPLSNLEINGHIENDFGQVNFFNAYKDIIIQGKSAKDSASIKAATISISAPKGSIAQGYTEGITNIGFTPELVLKEYAKQRENEISKGVTTNTEKTQGQNLTLAQMTEYENQYKKSGKNVNDSSSGIWLAGGSIFLNGDDININGTVQSGYSQFIANLDNCDSVINNIKQRYSSKGSPEVTDAYLREYCKLNQSGMLWDEKTGTYKYVVQAYYNPQTDKIILEDINSQGGKIYLTGRISNTGNGKIFAADGASDINIINKTGKALVANLLDVGEREGLIRIMDLGRNTDNKGNKILATLTEMTSKDTKVWYVTSQGQTEKPNKISGVSSEYNPQKGLTYNWSTGYQSVNQYTYTTSYDFTLWGAIDYNEQHWNTMKSRIDRGEISPTVLNKAAKQSGTYVGDSSITVIKDNNTYQLLLINKVGATDGPYTDKWTTYDNWTHFSGTDYYRSVYKNGNTETYKHSIKADYPIKIGFIHGNGDINVTTNSNLTLTSDIISKNNKANVKLTSSNGFIEQTGGKIYADNIWLNATNGIGSDNAINQQMQSTNGVFSAITKKGDVNLLSFNKAGEKDSSLKLTANTDNGNVSVLADASLLNGAEKVNAKGTRIDLTSNLGSIGTGKSLLTIQAGQSIARPGDTLSASVIATALNDVALKQTSGDMRIGKIVSKTGDVYLTSDGSVLDALPPSGVAQTNESTNDLIAKWKSLGIISEDGKDNSAEKKKEVIEGYKNNTKTLFARYIDLKKYYTADEHKNETEGENYKEYNSLKEMFGSYTSAEKWLEAQNKDKNSEYYRLQNEVTYGWTQDQLLYAIQNSIINKESGSTTSAKSPSDANIKGRNVIINAGGGIGRDEGYTVVDIS